MPWYCMIFHTIPGYSMISHAINRKYWSINPPLIGLAPKINDFQILDFWGGNRVAPKINSN
jgi:hypothetical protein